MNYPAPSAPPYYSESPQYVPNNMNYMAPPTYPQPVVYAPQQGPINMLPVVPVYQQPMPTHVRKQSRNDDPTCCAIIMGICCCCVLMEEEDNCTRY